jgi:hypothetical protein
MSETNESFVVCPAPYENGYNYIDTMAMVVAVLTLMGSIVAYFIRQSQSQKEEEEAKRKEAEGFDRALALDRARKQLSIFVGPMQRSWKTQNTILWHYFKHSGHGIDHLHEVISKKGQAYWMTIFQEDFLKPFVDDPQSFDAVMYRNLVKRRLKPLYTKIRELALAHMSDLADMPTQEEWLARYSKEDITSPHNGSMNIHVNFDTYNAWTLEFDDIVESWAEGDFRRMQPAIRVSWMICSEVIKFLYENAKDKEAKYNRHVTPHTNKLQMDLVNNRVRENVRVDFLQSFDDDDDDNDEEYDEERCIEFEKETTNRVPFIGMGMTMPKNESFSGRKTGRHTE